MKIAVIGSRNWTNREFIYQTLKQYFTHYVKDDVLISGGANGVDTIAEDFIDEWLNMIVYTYGKKNIWQEFMITKEIYEAKWDDLDVPGAVIKKNKFGKKYNVRAGFMRNELIVNNADIIVAFWDGTSKGTKHSIDLAIKKGIPVDIYIRR